MTRTLALAALGLALASRAHATLVITEVVEGNGGSFKYLEIRNNGASAVDLTSPQMSLRFYPNGASAPAATIDLAGSISAGGYFVVANNQADLDTYLGGGVVASQVSASINHNGDDAYELFDGTNVVDTFAGDWIGLGTAGGSDAVRSACNGAYFRVADEYPNAGDWGNVNNNAPPLDGGDSWSGAWRRAALTASNANATTVCTPFAGGGSSGAELLPAELAAFSVE